MFRLDFMGYIEMIANPSFDVNNFAKRFEASGQKVEGVGGRKLFARERNQTEAAPAALLAQSRTPKKSFVFLLEEKIGRAQNQSRKQNFSLVWRALASGGGAASIG